MQESKYEPAVRKIVEDSAKRMIEFGYAKTEEEVKNNSAFQCMSGRLIESAVIADQMRGMYNEFQSLFDARVKYDYLDELSSAGDALLNSQRSQAWRNAEDALDIYRAIYDAFIDPFCKDSPNSFYTQKVAGRTRVLISLLRELRTELSRRLDTFREIVAELNQFNSCN